MMSGTSIIAKFAVSLSEKYAKTELENIIFKPLGKRNLVLYSVFLLFT